MRTDGVQLSGAAVEDIRKMVVQEFGADYVPSEPRVYQCASEDTDDWIPIWTFAGGLVF
jgi:DNA topoisomerase I